MGEDEIAIEGRGLPLASGWEFLPTEAGLAPERSGLPEKGWLPARVPGTFASNLREAGAWTFDSARDLDAEDCWFRCAFARPDPGAFAEARLVFDGIATLSEVFLNGAPVLATDNMFVRHSVDVTERLRDRNELAVACRSLGAAMKAKKGRPRYRTRLVEQQQLRFFRTTLLGRMPGWTPPCPPVGPFRAVRLELEKRAWLLSPRLRCRLEGDAGVVDLSATLRLVGNARVERATLHAFGREHVLRTTIRGDGFVALDGQARFPSVPLWWPHTHGDQPLYEVGLAVRFGDGETVFHPLGRVGFRKLELDRAAGGFRLRINGADVFCRGACWSPLDVVTFAASRAELRAAIECARSAGMNMLRIPGTMAYEDDAFHEACDELGVLVWQDFMYANMDYPALDGAFIENAASEARSVVRRIGQRPSTAVFCGNSEVEQQAAMLGLPRDVWTNALFERVLPEIVGVDAPGVPYWPSSPSGGDLPFAINEGVSHYYGVGAYERPLDDARRSGVRFATECLAFANVPEDRLLEQLSADGIPPVHHPAWKRRVPRDRGASWDFDDVRDYYMERLFRRSPSDIRYSDPERYRQLSRVTTGEVMHRAFSEWRRPGSSCHGALVWLLRDVWPGAGWGVIDAGGTPKAAYFHLKRTLRPFCVLVSDEGLDGLFIHALNEGPSDVDVEVVLTLFRSGDVLVARHALNSRLPARAAITIPARQLMDTFIDVTFAYRFGPPSHDLVVVTLRDRAGVLSPSSAFYFPLGLPEAREPDVGLDAIATPTAGGAFAVAVSSRRFAQSVALDVEDAAIDDNYFHLEPGGQRTLRVEPKTSRARLTGTVRALNAHASTRIRSTE